MTSSSELGSRMSPAHFEPLDVEALDVEARGADGEPSRRFVAETLAGRSAFAPDAGAPPPDPEQLRVEAFDAGRKAGRAELPWSEADALRDATRALAAASEQFAVLQRDGLRAQRDGLIRLSLAIAERLVGDAYRGDPATLAPRIDAALAALPGAEPVTLRLSSADHAVLTAGESPLAATLADVRLESDAGLEAGDVVVEAGASRVDARIETLLERVRATLEPALASEPPPSPPAVPVGEDA